MQKRSIMSMGAALVVAAGAVSACGSSSPKTSTGSRGTTGASKATATSALGGAADSAALEALYKKAVAAGQKKIVIYGPTAGTDSTEYKAFEKSFPGITVTGVPVVGPPMSAKLSAEATSGKHVADIAYTGSTNMLQYGQSGYLSSYKPVTLPPTAKLAAETVGTGGEFYGVTDGVDGLAYNTNDVKSSEVPTTWTALTDSKWKGKIAIYDPTAIGEMEDAFAHLALVPADANLMAGLKANDVQLFPATSITGPLTAVAQGAKELAPATGYAFYLAAKAGGAPVGYALLKSDNYSVILYQGIVKGAPDPLAAELYESWMFTPQAGTAIASEGSYSTVLGYPAPTGLPALASVPQMPTISLNDIVAADNAAIAKSDKYWGS